MLIAILVVALCFGLPGWLGATCLRDAFRQADSQGRVKPEPPRPTDPARPGDVVLSRGEKAVFREIVAGY